MWRAGSETSAGANPVAVWRTDDDAEPVGDRLTGDLVASSWAWATDPGSEVV